jgi:chemotaxis protein methyltransferase CheR
MAGAADSALLREYALSDDDFQRIRRLVRARLGIALAQSKRELVYGRLSRRLRALKLHDFSAYLQRIESGDAEEMQHFCNAITTHLTSFFRERHHFEFLAQQLLPALERSNASTRRIRIWSAGCSTGEEPYTIAVVLRREIPDVARQDVRILATDIDTDVLAKASRGEYPVESLENIPDPYCRYFQKSEDADAANITVEREVRSLISFRQLNLLEPWPFKGPFDAIFCRNVMIYFDGPTKARLIERFTKMVRPGGWLYIGHSESLLGAHPGLHLEGRTIYRRDA